MKRMSPSSRLVRRPARSLGFSMTGPEVMRTLVPISWPRMKARVVLPRPGGPERRMCLRAWERDLAAPTMTLRRSMVLVWPVKSLKDGGRRAASRVDDEGLLRRSVVFSSTCIVS